MVAGAQYGPLSSKMKYRYLNLVANSRYLGLNYWIA